MNRILVVVVLILIPITIVTNNEDAEPVMYGSTLEKINLDIPIEEEKDDLSFSGLDENKTTQVLVSHNRDKSDAYYLDLEEYIIGVVAGEMPASFTMEALKAQAVASRTYALYKMEHIHNYVLSTTVSDQVYLTEAQMKSKWGSDYDYYYARVREAVESTKGEVLTYQDELIISYYFAISNGYTDNASSVFNESRDYLVSVDSSWDKNYQSYSSTYTLSKTTFCTKLGISCDALTISNVKRADNHYVREITIGGKTFTGREVFNKLNLKSTDFTITINGDSIAIQTLGFGHGVGMSQYGAQGMALNGYTYSDILTHYYQNTKISKI